jgi:hypothetical protein
MAFQLEQNLPRGRLEHLACEDAGNEYNNSGLGTTNTEIISNLRFLRKILLFLLCNYMNMHTVKYLYLEVGGTSEKLGDICVFEISKIPRN